MIRFSSFATMHDKEIRAVLRMGLRQKYHGDPDTAVIDELAIGGGRNRIDLALVNGVLHGFELKSDYDRLDRLRSQTQGYGTVCDKMTLVVGERHLRRAIDLVPEWWGVILVRSDSGRPLLRNLKYAQTNPSLNPISVARLLRRNEAAAFLQEMGYEQSQSRISRGKLCEFIAENVELSRLCQRVRECIRARQSVAEPRSYDD